ncbi:MAG: hypothetical protein QX198_17165 [Methylococcaceae bacterium]
MPALEEKKFYFWREHSYLAAFVPVKGSDSADARLQELWPKVIANEANGKLDLQKVADFFLGSEINVAELVRIRKKVNATNNTIDNHDVTTVFNSYCKQLNAKNVIYHYNAFESPFDVNFICNSNCMGRAKGFLQLMAVLGVPVDKMAYLVIGREDGEGKKVCRKADTNIRSEDVYRVPGLAPTTSPNSVCIKLMNGKLEVSPTSREPFGNHYAAFIDMAGLHTKTWDPLEGSSYKNGFSDAFTTYEKLNMVSGLGFSEEMITILHNPDNTKERLYILPSSKYLRMRVDGFHGTTSTRYFENPAFIAVESQLKNMTTMEPRVITIIDESDWNGAVGSLHPEVIKKMFVSQ